ncbi:MAG TPA: histidine phosphatase family protein [Candidatus Limnocylindrales bacterium]|nr:histidine phosphatase family protein [Candidatus Limnocylindrales bacterium]
MVRLITTVRHAATGNASRRVISGTLDEPLSEVGRGQARAFVERFGHLRADVVVSSPLSRSLETARALTGLGDDRIERWKSCMERDYGLLQGIPPDEVATWRSRIRYVSAGGIDHSVNPPEGETLGQVRARARRVAARLLARPEDSILVFSHQTLIQQLIGILTGQSLLEALAIDIAVLQVDAFDVDAGLPATWRPVHPGERSLVSW